MKPKLLHGIFVSLFFVVFAFKSFSQDVILLKNGDEVQAKVLEILPEEIQYTKWSDQNGKVISLSKGEIFMIKYQNGSKDIFSEDKNRKIDISSESQREEVYSPPPKPENKIEKTEIVTANSKNEIEVTVPVNTTVEVTPMDIKAKRQTPKTINYNQEASSTETMQSKSVSTTERKLIEIRDEYSGDWVDGKMQGKGKMVYKNGNIYEGDWKDNMRYGKGKIINKDGSTFEGEWKNDKMGYGTFTWPNGRTYTGYLN